MHDTGEPAPDGGRIPRALAAAGIIGPILFTTAFIAQGLFRRGEYNATTEDISSLEAGPGLQGAVQQVNFALFGLLLIAFAVGLHRGVRRSRAALTGPMILACNGVGLIIAGIFPLRQDAAGVTYDPLGVHSVNGRIFFLTIGLGLIVISRGLAADPRWRGLAAYVLATGIALLVMFVPFGVLTQPSDAVLHPWLGLVQRAILAIWLLCVIVLALRLRTVAIQTEVPPPTTRDRADRPS
ncbi:MAG: DUF998 domain-containing protein [Actinomycetota bacterium]|nr:DUF998 domain-containing protein [Actinomycetota bacterium]